ncbi:Monoterpene synthase [Forsythia ovata]|uniref:Monoterpene synthase n=1 Tax=Forsythia ovata TaxID=205694 RepID=A0ABD1S3N4_9LAMI
MEGRRSGNYEQSIWDDDYVQSISSPYVGKEYLELAENLKEKMRIIISEMEDQPDRLELIDNLQRLDVSYHFQDEIKKILDHIHLNTNKDYDNQNEKDLYSTALKFRILRQNGYQVPQAAFKFKSVLPFSPRPGCGLVKFPSPAIFVRGAFITIGAGHGVAKDDTPPVPAAQVPDQTILSPPLAPMPPKNKENEVIESTDEAAGQKRKAPEAGKKLMKDACKTRRVEKSCRTLLNPTE